MVQVKREGNRVIDFLFSEDFEFLLHEQDDSAGQIDSVESNGTYDVINAYTFNVTVNNNLSSERAPKFSKGFKLPVDVCFEKGVDYVVGAWILTDGSINISFRSRKTIFRSENRELTLEEKENWVEYPS